MLILLIEDHDDTRLAMKTLLGLSGHDVVDAEDGGQAIAALEARVAQDLPPFDCAVVDLGLPDTTGTELMRELLTRVPIKGIALTGSTSPSDIAECKAAGFSFHLPKPVTIEELEETLAKLLKT